jgi:hypothetical protein
VTGAAFDPVQVFTAFEPRLLSVTNGRGIFVSDNPACDFQWINGGLHHAIGLRFCFRSSSTREPV